MNIRQLVKQGSLLAAGLFLSACSAQLTEGVFDAALVAPPTSARPELAKLPAKYTKHTEIPASMSARQLMDSDPVGPGYEVADNVTSNGRYFRYSVKTNKGTYLIVGNALMQKHLLELKATDTLRKRKRTMAFAKGGANAVVRPVKSVVRTVTHPGAAAKQSYTNLKKMGKNVKNGGVKAAKLLTTWKRAPATTAKREDDNFFGDMVGRTQVRRDLALELKVDPYTHYKPLKRELNYLAGFTSAGQFGVNLGLNFVPGAGAYIITGVSLTDTITKNIVTLPPKKMAELNRKRLLAAGFEIASIKKFLLNPIYTPTEKSILTGKLVEMRPVDRRNSLIVFAGAQNNRSAAFEAIQSLIMAIAHLDGSGDAEYLTVLNGHPVAISKSGDATVIAAYDHLSWTANNAAHFDSLTEQLQQLPNRGATRKLVIAGSMTRLAVARLGSLGWKINDNASVIRP